MSPFVLLWIDNKGRTGSVVQGIGRDVAVNNMLSFFWRFLARAGIFLHCEWVPSAHNLADGISRHWLDEAQYGQWTLLEVPLKPLHSILQRCSHDTGFSATEAVALAWTWSFSFSLSDLVLSGEAELEMGVDHSDRLDCTSGSGCVERTHNLDGKTGRANAAVLAPQHSITY